MDSSGHQSPSGWDGTMKSLLNEALARHQEAEAKEERESEKAKVAEKKKNGDDEEIEKIVESINVSIKIVGCGGGGSNTINRCSEAGITGAQLAAVNTDAKHLLPSTRRRRSSSANDSRKASGPVPSRKSANRPPTRTRRKFETSSAALTSSSSRPGWAAAPGPAPRSMLPGSRKRKAP